MHTLKAPVAVHHGGCWLSAFGYLLSCVCLACCSCLQPDVPVGLTAAMQQWHHTAATKLLAQMVRAGGE
jgi:hypothetical protein